MQIFTMPLSWVQHRILSAYILDNFVLFLWRISYFSLTKGQVICVRPWKNISRQNYQMFAVVLNKFAVPFSANLIYGFGSLFNSSFTRHILRKCLETTTKDIIKSNTIIIQSFVHITKI